MISIKHTLPNINYWVNMISAGNRRDKDEEQKISTVCLAYVKGLSENIGKIYGLYDTRTILISISTLQRNMCRTKPNKGEDIANNCVYSIPFSLRI